MANRRLHSLFRHNTAILSSSNHSLQNLKTLNPNLQTLTLPNPLSPQIPTPNLRLIFYPFFTNLRPIFYPQYIPASHFSSYLSDNQEYVDEQRYDDDEDEGFYLTQTKTDEGVSASNCGAKREYTLEEKEEAMEIGYEVMGHLDRSEFALVQIGSATFKVSNGDCIYTEKLMFCEVNDKLILNTILMLGSQSQTIIGRPILPDASVHAVVEGHMLKRSKHYLGTKGPWQEVTKLRITDIQGIEKPETVAAGKTEMTVAKKPEKVAVAA